MKFSLVPFDRSVPLPFKVACEFERFEQSIKLCFLVIGDCSQIEWPSTSKGPALRLDLWQATCFEIFLKSVDGESYEEWNFSPSGDWGFFAFESYRRLKSNEDAKSLVRPLQFELEKVRAELSVEIPISEALAQIQISAVLKSPSGSFSYWALSHSKEKPDFHDPMGFHKL